MMKQPDLGDKILALRLAKGLTQTELAEKCSISLRTIQRIESAAVTPRSYTLKIIFEALDYNFEMLSKETNGKGWHRIINRLEQILLYVSKLFNLKTNTMKKVSVLSIIAFAIVFSLSSLNSKVFAQSERKAKKIIEKSSEDFMQWFNTGEIDNIVELYTDEACLMGRGCGKAFIKEYYNAEMEKYKFLDVNTTSISVSDKIAIEKGIWRIRFEEGVEISGEYLVEWHFIKDKWLTVNESSSITTGI